MSDTYRPFSERHGYSQPKGIQLEDMDDALRNSLWNVFDKNFTDTWLRGGHIRIYKHIWIKFLKKPADELNENTYVRKQKPGKAILFIAVNGSKSITLWNL